MSLLHQTDLPPSSTTIEREHHGFGFILALVCVALAILVASALFARIPVSNGIDSTSWFVGP